jgi:hypothetical protein
MKSGVRGSTKVTSAQGLSLGLSDRFGTSLSRALSKPIYETAKRD